MTGSGDVPAGRHASRGLALISVLWVSGVLALLAAGLASSSRTEGRLAHNLLENTRAEAMADAAVNRALLGLLESEPEQLWQPGRVYAFALPGGRARVILEDEDAKIDLNVAPPELLAGLFRAVGVEDEEAEALADRIADFRDDDGEARPLGAEDADYAAMGLEHGAKDDAFAANEELFLIPGMTARLYDRIRAHVTVFSGAEGFDPLLASPTVLRAIPDISEDVVQTLANASANADPFELISDEIIYDLELYFVFSRVTTYTIRAEGRSDGGATFVREAVVDLAGGEDLPYLVYVWQRGVPLDLEELAGERS
jgi:general secretion pathway protein K